MATTFQTMTVGQKGKEVMFNENFAQVPRYLGELASDPVVGGSPQTIAYGSFYFNTVSSKLKVLRTNDVWVNVA